MDRILFVLTSQAELGTQKRKTGVHLAEVTHAYEVFKTAGFEIDFVSPRGGRAPLDHVDLDDAINEKWINNDVFRSKIESTMTPEQVVPSQYRAVYFPGGHGAMFDLPDDEKISEIVGKIYDAGGVVGAVCHGVAGLLNVKTEEGQPLLAGKKVAAFTNEEEVALGLLDQLPFLLEDRLEEEGAEIQKAPPFQKQIVVSDHLITGQNPASARAVAEEIRKIASKYKSAFIEMDEATIAP